MFFYGRLAVAVRTHTLNNYSNLFVIYYILKLVFSFFFNAIKGKRAKARFMLCKLQLGYTKHFDVKELLEHLWLFV